MEEEEEDDHHRHFVLNLQLLEDSQTMASSGIINDSGDQGPSSATSQSTVIPSVSLTHPVRTPPRTLSPPYPPQTFSPDGKVSSDSPQVEEEELRIWQSPKGSRLEAFGGGGFRHQCGIVSAL